MPQSRIPKPCIERLPDRRGCPEYAYDGPRCPAHAREALATGTRSPGTTPAWRKARKFALERAGYACERCGKTDAESRERERADSMCIIATAVGFELRSTIRPCSKCDAPDAIA